MSTLFNTEYPRLLCTVFTLLPSMLILRVLVSHAWLSSSSVGNSAEPNSCVWGADTPDREESATTPHTCVDSV